MPDFETVKRLFLEALAGGGVRRSLNEIDWDVSGDCETPVTVPVWGRRSRRAMALAPVYRRYDDGSRVRLEHPELRQDTACHGVDGLVFLCVYVEGRCRKCSRCLRQRARQWSARCLAETQWASRTWFGTLTLNPNARAIARLEAQRRATASGSTFEALSPSAQFREICAAIGPALTKWIKRVRKVSGARLRYCLVSEPHADGVPYWHILLHEVTGEVRKSTLQAHWAQMGFSKFKLVAADQTSRPAHYVAKYISKFQGTRVRASLNYGTPQGVSAVGRSLTKEGRDPVMPDTSRTTGAEGNVEPISDELRRLSQFRRAISELFAGESVSSESVRSDPASRPEGWHGVSPPPGGQGVGPVAVGRAEQSKRDSVPRSCRSKAARSNYASARSGALSLATLVKLGP